MTMAREQIISLVQLCGSLQDAVALICTCKRFYHAICGTPAILNAIEACAKVRARDNEEYRISIERRRLMQRLKHSIMIPRGMAMTRNARELLSRAAIDELSRRFMAAGALAQAERDTTLYDTHFKATHTPTPYSKRVMRAARLLQDL